MLIFAPDNLRATLVEEFQRRRVPHAPWLLGLQSAGSGSVAALMVEVGAATAVATTAILAWWTQRRATVRLSIVLDDGRGQRQQLDVEASNPDTLPLLFAQAREVICEAKIRKPKAPKIKRVKLPAALRTKLLDEVRSHCPNPACGKSGVRNLEAHHIDGNRSNTVETNLLMLCRNCHGEAHLQLISRDMVQFWKRLVTGGAHPFLDDPRRHAAPKTEAPVVEGVNRGHAARNMEVHYHDVKPPRERPGIGTIGDDPQRRDYVYYLGKKYIDWRLKSKTALNDDREFSPAAARNVIQQNLGFAPYKAGVESFATVVEVITGMIDRTPFGSLNRSKGIRNYHTFEEHQAKMTRRKKRGKAEADTGEP